MSTTTLTPSEIAERGRTIYETRLRQILEPACTGKYIVIDLETGEYEIDEDGEAASQRAYRRNPHGTRYGMRVGYATWGQLGVGIQNNNG